MDGEKVLESKHTAECWKNNEFGGGLYFICQCKPKSTEKEAAQ